MLRVLLAFERKKERETVDSRQGGGDLELEKPFCRVGARAAAAAAGVQNVLTASCMVEE